MTFDGGVIVGNAAALVAARANVLVAGSAVFAGGAERYAANIAHDSWKSVVR